MNLRSASLIRLTASQGQMNCKIRCETEERSTYIHVVHYTIYIYIFVYRVNYLMTLI
jgi:hypothetical protein